MKIHATIIFIFTIITSLSAQSLRFNPYLQDANPNSIYILWETDYGEESIVEWGETNELGNIANGFSEISNDPHRIHTVQLVGLTRFTKYFYRVKTGDAISEIFSFKTPPFASDHKTFRMALMSDIQLNTTVLPNKYDEIIHEGIMSYLETEYGGELIDNLAMVLIPGDLVNTGSDYSAWKDKFFQFSDDLFNQVPVYPVLGNHEENSSNFFKYFKLPENGYEEHWWYKDYGNVRIIGLDSNIEFVDADLELVWLEEKLDEICSSDTIDFVFVELHHPHKSELWLPGESDFTGDVVERLEQFSTNCEKPSIHFFGHTHAYSRGQSRDHKHLWINVASAGGAIDYWGEYPNFDYDEFSVSQDEYGFVSVEISDDDDPKLIIKRIGRGDDTTSMDNVVRDELTIRLNPTIVTTPSPIFPIGDGIIPECVTLTASTFSSPNPMATHGQTHWQVSTDEFDFSTPVLERWKNFENWYFDIDTQAEDDLTDETIYGLEGFTTYWWHVRYRDKEFNWSEWSAPTSFTTTASSYSANLIVNPGSEDLLENWTIMAGVVESLTDGECAGISPHSGDRYFAVGGLCEESELGILTQDVDVTEFSDEIDSNTYQAYFGGYLSNYSGSDKPEMRLIFLDDSGVGLGSSETLSTLASTWTKYSNWTAIPELTRSIKVELKGTRYGGTDNDSYFDDLFLKIGTSDDCDYTSNTTDEVPTKINRLLLVPNPVAASSYISLEGYDVTPNVKFLVVNETGSKVTCKYTLQSNSIIINKNNFSQGMYFFLVKDKGAIIGEGKFIVE